MPLDQVSPITAGASETLVFDDTSGGVGFTSSKIVSEYVRANIAHFILETAQCRMTVDGTAPTTTTGIPIDPGDDVTIMGASDITNFRCIRTGSTSEGAYVTYSR